MVDVILVKKVDLQRWGHGTVDHNSMSDFLICMLETSPLLLWVAQPRTATGMDGTLPKCNFENLKPVEISKNSFGII